MGVLCFHNDSKDDLESAEKGAEWERGKCNQIISNEIRQSVCSFSSQITGDISRVKSQL